MDWALDNIKSPLLYFSFIFGVIMVLWLPKKLSLVLKVLEPQTSIWMQSLQKIPSFE